MEWFFSGIGSAILSGIAGLIVGGKIGYHIGIHKKVIIKQKQTAEDNSTQIQIGNTRDV